MKKNIIVIAFIGIFLWKNLESRSIYRPLDPLVPEISVKWVGDSKPYILRKYHLEDVLFKLFDKDFFMQHLVPEGNLSYRSQPQKTVASKQLTSLIDNLVSEIKQGKKTFSNFTILQSKDYNFTKETGLLVVKFNDYPFVVKLFLERPDSFVSPFSKGFEPIFFFFMAGGINRHLAGFTRIKNREIIMARLANSPWAGIVDIPRKWHYIPSQSQWIEIKGKNIGTTKEQSITFPGTYCIMADAIVAERNLSILNAADKKQVMDLCNYLNIWIDPHLTNFMIEKDQKLVIVDTEHFPSFVGLREKISFSSYSDWYLYLAGKCCRNVFLQNKWERRHPQKPVREMSLVDFNFCRDKNTLQISDSANHGGISLANN